MLHGRGGLYPEKPDTYYTPEPVLQYSRIRRYKRPSLWARFTWWLGDVLLWVKRHEDALSCAFLILIALYWALVIAEAARSGRLGPNW
jgi:hypothetical protein